MRDRGGRWIQVGTNPLRLRTSGEEAHSRAAYDALESTERRQTMSTRLPRKALIAVSSFNGAIYPGGHKTGVFFVEALHPYEVLTAAGFEVDLASETGTCGFDDISLTPPFLSGSDHAIFNSPKHPFMVKIRSQLKRAAELSKEDYGFFFASAGHSALYDYPTSKGLQEVAADACERGGVVGTVCHGPAILPGILDSKTGKSIIAGKTVTGFTIEGELIFRILEKLRADGVVPVVEAVTAAGAFYSGPMGAFDDYSITSGRVVTGTNPASGRSTTERGVKLFDNLELP
jgi:D-lactate dehydratase